MTVELNDFVYEEEMVELCQAAEVEFDLVNLCIQVETDQAALSRQSGGGVKRKIAVTKYSSSKRPFSQEPSTSAAVVTTNPIQEETTTSVSSTNNNTIECPNCKVYVNRKYYTNHLKSKTHSKNVLSLNPNLNNVQLIETAFGRRIVTYRIPNSTNTNSIFETPEHFLNIIKNTVSVIQVVQKSLKPPNLFP
ncbi:uncharacterized protein LOC120636745 [Pararge aegeria]|nr:uncharacterized protein LOC120636745 [Pararge aegeria]